MDQIWKEPTDNIYDQTKQGTPKKNNISDMKKQNDEDIYIYIYMHIYYKLISIHISFLNISVFDINLYV